MCSRILPLFLAGAVCFAGCGGSEPAKTQSEEKTADGPTAKVLETKAPLVGKPAGSGFADGNIRVQIGTDEELRESHSPDGDNAFLLVVLQADGEKTFVPGDYKVEIDGNMYDPKAAGFGMSGGIYASLEYLVAEKVALSSGEKDLPQHDGERIQACQLKHPQVVLVYDVPTNGTPVLKHGGDAFPLSPDLSSLQSMLGDETMASLSNTDGGVVLTNQNVPKAAYQVQVVEIETVKLDLAIGGKQDALQVVVSITADNPGDVPFKYDDLSLMDPENGRRVRGARAVYFDFDDRDYTAVAGAEIIEEEKFENADLVGLESGQINMPVSRGSTAIVKLFFPKVKPAGDLMLRFPGVASLSLPVSANPLGNFSAPETPLPENVVVGAPIIGNVTRAGFLTSSAKIAGSPQRLSSPTTGTPLEGQQFFVMEFRVEGEPKFRQHDYLLATPDGLRRKPRAVAFGKPPWTFVEGLNFETVPLKQGAPTAPQIRKGTVIDWNLAEPHVTLLYDVPRESSYTFVHGGTQFVIEPKDLPAN